MAADEASGKPMVLADQAAVTRLTAGCPSGSYRVGQRAQAALRLPKM